MARCVLHLSTRREIPVRFRWATRSISVSLDEELLAALDAQGGNHSASLTEAIQFWLRRRELERLREAYGQLAQIQGGDLDHAMADGAAMGAAALQGPIGRSDVEVVRQVLLTLAPALDLSMQEAWSED